MNFKIIKHSRPTLSQQRAALTLLELLVVLVILTIVATVAVSSLQPRVETARFDQTRKMLEEISNASVGARHSRQVDGTPLVSGFVADIGRLPIPSFSSQASGTRTSNEETQQENVGPSSATSNELDELWNHRSSLAQEFPFQFRMGPTSPVDYSDVQIPCGWRGPYLRVQGSQANSQVLDAWGAPFEYQLSVTREIESVVWNPKGSFDQGLASNLAIGKVSVTGTINFDQTLPPNLSVVLLTPDPDSSRTVLAVKTDESVSVGSFEFNEVAVGLRAICVMVDNRRIETRYVQVPHEGLSIVIDLSGKLTAINE